MNPGYYPLIAYRGARLDRYFDCKDETGARVPLAGWTPMLNVWRDGDLALTNLPDLAGNPGGIGLISEPDGVNGRVALFVASDVIDSLLKPFGTDPLAMRYRLDLISDMLELGGNVPLLYGPFSLADEEAAP